MATAKQRRTRLQNQRSLPRIFLWVVFVVFLFPPGIEAQESTAEAPPPQAVSLSDIPTRAAAENDLLDQTEVLLSRASDLDEIDGQLSDREKTIAKRLISLKAALAAASSREALSEIEQEWQELDKPLESWEKDLHGRTGVMAQQLNLLTARQELWRQTVLDAEAAEAPAELIALASTTSNDLQNAFNSLEEMQIHALALQGKIGRARASVNEALDQIKSEESDLLNNLTKRERPPLWTEAVAGIPASDLFARASSELSDWWSSIYSVVRGAMDRVVFQLLLLIAFALFLRGSRKAARAWAASDPSVATGMSVFEKPVALAALAALLLTPWLYLSTPPAVDDAVGLLLVLPVLRLLLPLLDKPVRPALYLLAGVYVLDRLRDLVEAAPLVARLVFIVEMIAAIAIVVWLIRSKALHSSEESESAGAWRDRIRFALHAALALLIVAALASVAGYVRLAVLIGYGVLNSAYLALLLAALLRAADAIVALALHSKFAQTFRVIGGRTPILRRRFKSIFAVLVVVIWVLVTLDLFALRDYLVGLLSSVLFAELKKGSIAISLADVLAFGVTIVAAVLLARLITLILEEDVFSRVDLGRGIPFAISSLIKYSIIALGFLLAVGAMGIGMDKITILLGAFGVGLGFGLQNIVNNFVSGLILIFERPVQVGDTIDVGSVSGRITRIGIRSSTIRSFEGADITLPNGSLLSEALTNWTMTDRNRRIEVSVGVAYGTDPDLVIKILKGALEGQEGLLESPEPQVLFAGFGDSSLDFLLRAWVADNDMFVRIRSQISIAVNRELTRHGIEIPFPQRDLHVRSVASDIPLPGKP